jgi:hypothetical protein
MFFFFFFKKKRKKKVVPFVKKTEKKYIYIYIGRRRSCLLLKKQKKGKKIKINKKTKKKVVPSVKKKKGNATLPVEKGPCRWRGTVGWGEERECFSPVKYGRERERCRPVETESGEQGRPTGREEGVPERERERDGIRWRTADRPGRGSAGEKERERE